MMSRMQKKGGSAMRPSIRQSRQLRTQGSRRIKHARRGMTRSSPAGRGSTTLRKQRPWNVRTSSGERRSRRMRRQRKRRRRSRSVTQPPATRTVKPNGQGRTNAEAEARGDAAFRDCMEKIQERKAHVWEEARDAEESGRSRAELDAVLGIMEDKVQDLEKKVVGLEVTVSDVPKTEEWVIKTLEKYTARAKEATEAAFRTTGEVVIAERRSMMADVEEKAEVRDRLSRERLERETTVLGQRIDPIGPTLEVMRKRTTGVEVAVHEEKAAREGQAKAILDQLQGLAASVKKWEDTREELVFGTVSKVMPGVTTVVRDVKDELQDLRSRTVSLEAAASCRVMEKVLEEGKQAEASKALLAMVKVELEGMEKRIKAWEKEEARKALNESRRADRPLGEEVDARLEAAQRSEGRIEALEKTMAIVRKEQTKEWEAPEGWQADHVVLQEAWGDVLQRLRVVEAWQQGAAAEKEQEAKDREAKDRDIGKELGIQEQERRAMMVRIEKLEREDARRREGEPSRQEREMERSIKMLQEDALGKDKSIADLTAQVEDLVDKLKFKEIERVQELTKGREKQRSLQEDERGAAASPRDSLGTSLVSSVDMPAEEWALLEEKRGKEEEKKDRKDKKDKKDEEVKKDEEAG